jgi:methionyl-tRNA formyltransferase
MRIVYLGNQRLGCRCLEHLISQQEDVCGVFALPEDYWKTVSGTDEGTAWFPSVARVAESAGITVLQPADINAPPVLETIRALKPDVLFSVSWDQMLGEELLAIPARGCINMHDSLLPRHRGHAPINWAIIHGDRETGMTMHYMEAKADTGDIIAQKRVPIHFEDRAIDVFDRVVAAGVELFREMLPLIRSGRTPRTPQDPARGCYGPRRRPSDGWIDWNRGAVQTHNFVRALTRPYPGAFSFLEGRKLFIWKGRPAAGLPQGRAPGEMVLDAVSGHALVATADGFYRLESAQFDDGSVFVPAEWLSGTGRGSICLSSPAGLGGTR